MKTMLFVKVIVSVGGLEYGSRRQRDPTDTRTTEPADTLRTMPTSS